MSRWGRRIFLLSDESEMRSGKIMALVKGVWEFCSFLFIPQREGAARRRIEGATDIQKLN